MIWNCSSGIYWIWRLRFQKVISFYFLEFRIFKFLLLSWNFRCIIDLLGRCFLLYDPSGKHVFTTVKSWQSCFKIAERAIPLLPAGKKIERLDCSSSIEVRFSFGVLKHKFSWAIWRSITLLPAVHVVHVTGCMGTRWSHNQTDLSYMHIFPLYRIFTAYSLPGR